MNGNPCPSPSADIKAKIEEYEKQLKERHEECEYLLARKNAHANEYIERMAELRDNHEKHLADKEDTIRYLRELAEKRQRDLEKAEAISANYLQRIDVKNKQLDERDTEIRHLNTEMLKMSTSHNEEVRSLIDRILRMSDYHSAEIKALIHRGQPE